MKKPNPPSIITVAVITTITIVFWIFFSVYQILTGEVDVDVPQELLKPIDPTLNQELLNKINDGIVFQRDEVVHFSTNNSNAQIPQPQNDEEITPTSSPSPTPTVSENEPNEFVSTPSSTLIN